MAANAITTAKIADANVTDAKISTVSGSKVTGNITGSAANVTGIVPVANGGTGQTTIAGVQAILGLAGTTVAIGASSGSTNQGAGAIGVGNGTGQTNQGSQSIAIGYVAGYSNQGANSVAIGANAAQGGQGEQSIAIGYAANSGADNATALGGFSSAGHTNATAIGYQAATTGNNTIQLGADGVTIPGSTAITNVKTSGTLTAGTVTYPNAHGTTGQVLSTTGSGTLTWVAPSASSLSGTVDVANGGTGTTSLTGYVKGNGTSALTANASIPVADVTGAAPIASPTFTGTPAAPTAVAGTNTTQVATTEFVTGAIATATIPDATTSAKGKIQLAGDLAGTAALPVVAANAITTAKIADANVTTAKIADANVTDAKIVTVSGSKVTGNITSSAANVTGTVAIANGGTGLTSAPLNGQIDIGNGTGFTRATLTAGSGITITNNAGAITITAAVRPTTDQTIVTTAAQTSFTLSEIPVTAKVWMFINGVRTNNLAYSVSGTTVTYTPSNNNSYALVVGDRIQFDYCY